MKCEKRIPAAALLLLLCCLGGVAIVNPTGTRSVLVVSAMHQSQTIADEQSRFPLIGNAVPVTAIISDVQIPNQIEIVELHNLPPPAAV